MDYEIDIEEHDVLDNPVIKTIFPDISVIKKEITEYFEDSSLNEELNVAETQTENLSNPEDFKSIDIGIDNSQNTPLKHHCLMVSGNEQSQAIQSNKIILGSKPKVAPQNIINKKLILGSKHNADTQKILIDTVNYDNENSKKLILVTKPNASTCNDINTKHGQKVEFREMRLILQDIKSYLNQNGRYCKQCCRLFLSKNALEVHRAKMHQNKICVNKYSAKYDTSDSRYKCNICSSCFCNNGNLFRHYRSVHQKNIRFRGKGSKINSETFKSKKPNKKPTRNPLNEIEKTNKSKQVNYTKTIQSSNKCNFCDMQFSTYGSLKRHHSRKHENVISNSNTRSRVIELGTWFGEKQEIVPENNDIEMKVSTEKDNCTLNPGDKINSNSPNVKSSTKDHKNKLNDIRVKGDSKEKLKKLDKVHHQVLLAEENIVVESSDEDITNDHKEPKYVTRSKKILSKDSNVCQHCKKDFPDQKSLIEHMYEILEPKTNSSGSTQNASDMTKKETDKILFMCRQCSYYLPSIQAYFAHMIRNHKTEKFLEVKKEKYDPQCKYCPYKSSSIATHNKHVQSYHIDLTFLRIENEIENDKNNQINDADAISGVNSFAMESVLFECNKCSICFLSSDVAKDHKKHVELLIHWKCLICDHILKEQDKEMHLKQHSFSQSLKVYNLNETAICNVLYNCTKCAIHFTEKRYQEHYENCETDTTDSSYCSLCDILVDKMEMTHHKTQHEHMRDIFDFTIIESNLVVDTAKFLKRKGTNIEPEIKPRKRVYEQHNCLTYCPTCKSFLSQVALKNKSHIEGICSQLLTFACELCGLIFTSSTLQIHKDRHEKEKKLRLQDFKFFDHQGIQVRPPIPEYPHCKICKIYFVRKIAISRHICGETDFLTCGICNIKLSRKTFKLHMAFHLYFIKNTFENSPTVPNQPSISNLQNASAILEKKSNAGFELKPQIKSKISQEKNKSIIKSESPDTEVLPNASEVNNDILNPKINTIDLIEEHEREPTNEHSLLVMYTCKSCDTTFESYDKVIKHCQAHYSIGVKHITSSVKKCKQCLLKFDSYSYLEHQHSAHSGVNKTQILKFDPICFTSKNIIWVKHIFQTLPEKIVKELLKKSIYQHEHRVLLECIQKGSTDVSVYKCDSCDVFMDAGSVYKHAENPCGKVRKHPCSICGLPFITIFNRSCHDKLHKQIKGLTIKSLNIILFNQSKDKDFNDCIFGAVNQYLLYQCRNCDGVVEKSVLQDHMCDRNALVKCITCGLLISNLDFEAHSSKHTDLGNFYSENFKVILFGRESNYSKNNGFVALSSGFSGTVYDYTMYKCQVCEMCLKNNENTEKHACTPYYDIDRCLCSECDLYFPSSNIRHHVKQHNIDPDFTKKNINVITFNNTLPHTNDSHALHVHKNTKIKQDQVKDSQIIKISTENDTNFNDIKEKYIENTSTSVDDDDITTLKSQNLMYVINDCKDENNDCSSQMDIHDVKSFDKDKVDAKDANGEDKNDDDDIHNNVSKELETLYKCKCGLHFINKSKATDHTMKCQPKAKQSKQNCSKCHLLFNTCELFSHLVIHHKDKTKVDNFKVIEIP